MTGRECFRPMQCIEMQVIIFGNWLCEILSGKKAPIYGNPSRFVIIINIHNWRQKDESHVMGKLLKPTKPFEKSNPSSSNRSQPSQTPQCTPWAGFVQWLNARLCLHLTLQMCLETQKRTGVLPGLVRVRTLAHTCYSCYWATRQASQPNLWLLMLAI